MQVRELKKRKRKMRKIVKLSSNLGAFPKKSFFLRQKNKSERCKNRGKRNRSLARIPVKTLFGKVGREIRNQSWSNRKDELELSRTSSEYKTR